MRTRRLMDLSSHGRCQASRGSSPAKPRNWDHTLEPSKVKGGEGRYPSLKWQMVRSREKWVSLSFMYLQWAAMKERMECQVTHLIIFKTLSSWVLHRCSSAYHLSIGVKAPLNKSFKTMVNLWEMVRVFGSNVSSVVPRSWGRGADMPECNTVKELPNSRCGNSTAFSFTWGRE